MYLSLGNDFAPGLNIRNCLAVGFTVSFGARDRQTLSLQGECAVVTKWDERFMTLAFQIAEWSSCFKPERKVGAVIVKNKRILTTGYNGAPAGMQSCMERRTCLRNELGIRSGERHELCYAIHAEQNAIIQAAKLGVSIDDATMYCTHQPCAICAKMIINAGISRLVYAVPYPDDFAKRILDAADIGIEWIELAVSPAQADTAEHTR